MKAPKLHLFSFSFLLFLLLNFPILGTSKSAIRYLPGLDGPLPSELETGYVNVDESNGIELFYYFFESENNPVKDPLIVWFTGGPACSGLSAIFFESGPFIIRVAEFNRSTPTLDLNPHSWTKVTNIVYIDAPAGTGFSYSVSLHGTDSNDMLFAKQGYAFIRKWLTDHPQFLSNPLYVGGDSYSGQVVPVVVEDITDGIEKGDKPLINLKGYVLGNPITNRYQERNFAVPFAHGMGLLSDELFESLRKSCGGEYVNEDPENVECSKALQLYRESVDGLEHSNILLPLCRDVVPEPKIFSFIRPPSPDPEGPCGVKFRKIRSLEENSSNNNVVPPPFPGVECQSTYGFVLLYYWANDDRVQTALHIRQGKGTRWIRCSFCGMNYTQNVVNSVGYHANLSRKQLRSLIYHGDHDLIVPFSSTQTWIRSLNYAVSKKWRPWFVGNQVAGYTSTYANNMTLATLKGGGHIAFEHRKESLAMINRWLSYKSL